MEIQVMIRILYGFEHRLIQILSTNSMYFSRFFYKLRAGMHRKQQVDTSLFSSYFITILISIMVGNNTLIG